MYFIFSFFHAVGYGGQTEMADRLGATGGMSYILLYSSAFRTHSDLLLAADEGAVRYRRSLRMSCHKMLL